MVYHPGSAPKARPARNLRKETLIRSMGKKKRANETQQDRPGSLKRGHVRRNSRHLNLEGVFNENQKKGSAMPKKGRAGLAYTPKEDDRSEKKCLAKDHSET